MLDIVLDSLADLDYKANFKCKTIYIYIIYFIFNNYFFSNYIAKQIINKNSRL